MFLLSAVVLTGCMKMKLQTPARYLPTQLWKEECPNSDPEVTWLRLRPDGLFDYAYGSVSAENWRTGDDERWHVDGTELVVSWNDGYATSRYALMDTRKGVITGETSKSCGASITLERE